MSGLAEGGGIEPLTLPRCHPSFRGSLPDRSGGTFLCEVAEGAGIELARPVRTDDGLASRCITALPTFRVTGKIDLSVGAQGVDSNPRPLAYKASALPAELQGRWSFGFGAWGEIIQEHRWCAEQDSNPQYPRSKRGAFANFAIGAMVESEGVEPPRPSLLAGYSRAPYRSGNSPTGGPAQIRTENDALLRGARLPITPQARNYSPSRYRNRKGVREVGFEPTTTRVRGADSGRAELLPGQVGRGLMAFMGASIA